MNPTLYEGTNDATFYQMACNIAVDDGLIAKNPCKGVKLPRPDDEEIHPLTPEQVDTLRMGHSSITVTADRYGHLYQGNTQDADALDRLLKRGA